MQRDIERAEAQDPEAGRWKVDEGWLHPEAGPDSNARRADGVARGEGQGAPSPTADEAESADDIRHGPQQR
jgi:hypothetical protein